MQYDPIKRSLGSVFSRTPFLRVLFYKMLDILLLRTWYLKKELRRWAKGKGNDVRILDAGSGFGQYEYFLSSLNKNWKIKGVDVKDEQIADCNRFFTQINRTNVSFETEDLTRLAETNTYDLVISSEVMEHIEEDALVMEKFYKAMKPDGMLLISTPSDKNAHHEDDDPFVGEHVRDGYSPNDIGGKLSKGRFSEIQVRYTYGVPGKISWHLSMKYPLLMLNATKLFFVVLPLYYVITLPFVLLLNLMDVRMRHKSGNGLLVKAFNKRGMASA